MAELTPKQDKTIAALLSEPTIGAAAAKLGIGERTIYTWLTEPAFADAYRDARRQAVSQAIGRLQQQSSIAANRLVELLTCGRASVELAAAKSILELAIKAVEIEDLAARLAALEAAYAEHR